MLGSSESRRRKKDTDRDRDSTRRKDRDKEKEKDPDRHRSGKTSRSARKSPSTTSSKETDRHRDKDREVSSRECVRPTTSHSIRSAKKMGLVPELERRGSLDDPTASRTSLPYPSFSKAHSKEAVFSRENLAGDKKSPYTPEPTDLGKDSTTTTPEKSKENSTGRRVQTTSSSPTKAPPSPPLTATTVPTDLRKTASANSMRRTAGALHREMEHGRRSVESGTRLTRDMRSHGARSTVRESELGISGTDLTSTTTSEPSTVRGLDKAPRLASPSARQSSPANTRPPGRTAQAQAPSIVQPRGASEVTQSTDSDATSIAPAQPKVRIATAESLTESEASPASIIDSSPRTPTQHSVLPSVLSSHPSQAPRKDHQPIVEVLPPHFRSQSVDSAYSAYSDAQAPLAPPPPPPPPPQVSEAPRVDYLLQHGGLSHPIPRSLLGAIDNTPVLTYSQYTSPRMPSAQTHDVHQFFAPLQKLLDDYSNVMTRNGSLAVATGYRSVARRLLDRLEAVFARNISSEHCTCIMCIGKPLPQDDPHAAGVNWGEILELVSGRCDLPSWPPFESNPVNSGLGISELEAPCQRLDVDVPEEYRAHYQQQSRKTKLAVQSWLSNQQDTAPEEADEETLTFAMLTRLEQDKRSLFYALLYGLQTLPGPRFQPPSNEPVPESITKAALALQRLYRLYAPPRAQLVVMYLIRNPNIHSVLATLAAVTKAEWEILVSGRFDGFLWSGADNPPPFGTVGSPGPVMPPSRGPSRGPNAPVDPSIEFPFSPPPGGVSRPASRFSRAQTPAGAPVQLDEETEIAVLAEIEREIYLGMEALEDAFESLHQRAELVRQKLRERSASLAMVAQARRGWANGGVEVRIDTPASGFGGGWGRDVGYGAGGGFGVDRDEVLDELRSEILPDDSASNVSHARRRKRGRERRTPAPVEEVDEFGHGYVDAGAGAGAERVERVVVVERPGGARRGSGANRKSGYAH